MSQINEFAINLPIGGVPALTPSIGQTVATAPETFDVTASVAVPAEVSPECSHISVYSDSIQPVSYDDTSPTVCFDMVLNVSIRDPQTGSCKNYKVIKRLAFDRVKLACQAEYMTPVSVVEAESEEQKNQRLAEEAAAVSAAKAAKRARELAGLE
jgi:hypothetical protein